MTHIIANQVGHAASIHEAQAILKENGIVWGPDIVLEYYPLEHGVFMYVWTAPDNIRKEIAHWIPDLGTVTTFTPFRPYGLRIQGTMKAP